MRTRTCKRGTSRKPQAGGCIVHYDPDIGELTGLVHLSRVPWDTPNAWQVDALVTFELDDWRTGLPIRRTGGYEMRIVMPAGSSVWEVRERARELLTRICAVEATITYIATPMDIPTIQFIQEFNAALAKEWRNHEGHEEHEG